MNNKDFLKDLDKRLNNEEITLPESLSAENIELLINEKGGILEPKRPKEHKKGKVIKIITSVAAVFVLIIGIAATVNLNANKIDTSKQDEIIEQQTSDSDYSKIETAVLNYYRDIYNTWQSNKASDLLNFGSKNGAAEEVADSENTAHSNSSASSSATGTVYDDMYVGSGYDMFSSEESLSDSAAYSSTNVQVSGVDESDIIKNDGRYIYYMKDNKVVITDCQKPDKMNVVSEIAVSDDENNIYSTAEMFLYNNKLILTVNQSRENVSSSSSYGIFCCDCAYAVEFDTVIRIYDVTDKSAPELCYSQFIAGNYVSSRVVNGKLITVSDYTIPYSSINDNNFEDACEEVKAYSVPQYSVNGGEMQKIPSDRIGLLDEEEPTEYIITAVIDLNNSESEPLMNAYLGGGSEIYCTQNELFVAECEYSTWTQGEREKHPADDLGQQYSCVTHIYKFDITDEGVIYNTDARVGGTWLNQFSMDKYGDYFRIVTNGMECNNGEYSSDDNMLYILDKDMNIVGFLDWIAIGEEIKSARFMGNTLYLVTFYQTDPLFVIDLSDPTAPEIKGELKIPGFSSYLHPIGEDLVIGVGEGGTTSGTDGSAKVSLFDVSDPCDPKELDNYTVADAYFDTDHKAFMTVDEDTFALCLTEYYYDMSYNYNEKQKIVVFDVTDNGITIQGEYSACKKNTATEYSTSALRGAFIDETLFAVNGYGIMSYRMSDNSLIDELRFS